MRSHRRTWNRRPMLACAAALAVAASGGCAEEAGAPSTFTLSLLVGPNGTVTVDGVPYAPSSAAYAIQGDAGIDLALAVAPSTGYAFAGWSGADGADVTGSGPTYSLRLDGNKAVQAGFGYDGYVYVSKAGSDDTATGHVDAPWGTIGAAVAAAAYGQVVRVSSGTYVEHVALKAGVALEGGYSPLDWGLRSPGTYVTTIADDRTTGGTAPAPNAAILADGAGVNAVVAVDGFHVEAGAGTHTAGVLCVNGASPMIRSNWIHGGTGTASSTGVMVSTSSAPEIRANTVSGEGSGSTAATRGIACDATSPIISHNAIEAGVGGQAFGILVEGGGSPVIDGNAIRSGTGYTSIGVAAYDSSPRLVNDTIEFAAGTSYSFGVFLSSSSGVTISHCTIVGRTGATNLYAVATDFDCTASVTNTILSVTGGSGRAGVFDGGGAVAITLSHSVIDVADDVGIDFTGALGLVTDAPVLGGEDGLHLTAATPTSISQGGLTLGSVTVDKDGAPRTEPYSIGAYERD